MKKVKLLALISAVITALLLLIFLNSLSKSSHAIKTGAIVAAVDIPENTVITAEMIRLTELPAESVIPGVLTDQSMVIGKVAESKIFTGEQLLSSKLISAGNTDSKTLAYAIEPGMRAINIPVDQISGLSYLITPGNHVDIIAQLLSEKSSGTAQAQKISYVAMVLENIKVLAVDNVLSESGKVGSETPQYTAITLQVTPKQAMELSMAQFEGQLKVVLRSPLDEKTTNQQTITLDSILVK